MARGGGQSRGGRGSSSRPAGLNFDWLKDDAELDFGPTPLFPKVDIQQPPPLSRKEQEQVNHFLDLRRQIHDGPTYAIIGNTSQIERYATFDAAQVDPFEGLPTYSNKYKMKKRTLPQLNTRSYEREFFPKELWATLKIRPDSHVNGTSKLKRALDDGTISDGEEAVRADGKRQRLLDGPAKSLGAEFSGELSRATRPKRLIEDDEEEDGQDKEDSDAKADDSDDQPEDEEEKDDVFEDEEDDDYNAEQYFDDGSDHNDDGGGDDGDGDGDTYG